MIRQPMQVGTTHKKWGPKPLTSHRRRRWRESPVALSLLFAGVVCLGVLIGRVAYLHSGRVQGSGQNSQTGAQPAEAGTSTWQSQTQWSTRVAEHILQGSTQGALLQTPSGGAQGNDVFLHAMDDEALVRRVLDLPRPSSGAPSGSSASSGVGRPKKLALMFLTLGTLPLAPFWSRFLSGNTGKFSVYVYSPGNASKYLNDPLPPVFHGRRVPGKSFGWGHMSTVEAERRLLANAMLDVDNARFMLLSDSCIPLFNFSFIYSYLMDSPYSFVKGVHVGTSEVVGTGHWNADFLPLVTIRQWVNGGTWFVVDRELALAVVKDFNFFSTFNRACEFAKGCYPEEHYMQTMVHLLYGTKLVNRTLTWDDFSAGGISPSWFSETDVLPQNISQSLVLRLGVGSTSNCLWRDGSEHRCYLFARQFKPSTLKSLLGLAPHMGLPSAG